MWHAKPTAIPLTFLICKFNFPFSSAFSPRVIMKNLINSLIENFSNQHIFNLGQYDSFSRLDSFGDIPGHEIILFLDLQILWALSPSSFCSSEWVLLVVIGSYVDFPGQRCQCAKRVILNDIPG